MRKLEDQVRLSVVKKVREAITDAQGFRLDDTYADIIWERLDDAVRDADRARAQSPWIALGKKVLHKMQSMFDEWQSSGMTEKDWCTTAKGSAIIRLDRARRTGAKGSGASAHQ